MGMGPDDINPSHKRMMKESGYANKIHEDREQFSYCSTVQQIPVRKMVVKLESHEKVAEENGQLILKLY